LRPLQGILETGFVPGVVAGLRNPCLDHRQASGRRLRMQHVDPDALHRDALEAFGNGGEQADHVDITLLTQHMQRPRGILAAAP